MFWDECKGNKETGCFKEIAKEIQNTIVTQKSVLEAVKWNETIKN